jgi:hypothetical protein
MDSAKRAEVARWVECQITERELKQEFDRIKNRLETAQRASEQALKKLQGWLGPNKTEQVVRVPMESGKDWLVQLEWHRGTEDRRKEDCVTARILEVE